ncbi:SGNH/GDSL hydrolase family protein [Granulosicoccaceae sp. 1_MG-2023]|nr:SGNH/GDSL hydrolase family protein [Granulosicoccaceae sp. 1_MG-2023]
MTFNSVSSPRVVCRRLTPLAVALAVAALSACSDSDSDGAASSVVDDSYAFATSGSVSVPASKGVLSNDGADFSSVAIESGLTSGSTLSLLSDGSFTYSPASGVSEESFVYSAVDEDGNREQGTVTLYVVNGTSACSEINVNSSSVSLSLAPGGVSADLGLSFSLSAQPEKGTVSGLSETTGQATFAYSGGARGADAIGVTVSDEFGNTLSYEHELGLYPVRIMPLGDSITQGINGEDSSGNPTPTSVADRVGYREYLYDLLLEDGYSFDFVGGESAGSNAFSDVEHEGHPGFTDYELAGESDPDCGEGTSQDCNSDENGGFNASQDGLYKWLAANGADVLLIHAGTNNVRFRTTADGLERLLDELDGWESDNWSAHAFVAKIIDKNKAADDHENVGYYNANVETLVNSRISSGDDLTLVDIYSAVGTATSTVLSSDGTHPTAAGYKLMADGWKEAIDENPLLLGKCN